MGLLQKYYKLKSHYRRYGWAGVKLKQQIDAGVNKLTFQAVDYKHPVFLRNHTSDIEVFYNVLFHKEYNFFKKINPKTIIDLGSNIGLASVFYANMYPEASIIAVEPEKDNFLYLKKNLESYNNIRLYNKAIWNKSATLAIEDNGLNNWGFEIKEKKNVKRNQVEAISLDQIILENNIDQIDLLKIDIEGSEKELFECHYDKWLPKVRNMVIELHDHMRPDCSKTVFKALNNYNYRITTLGENLFIEFE